MAFAWHIPSSAQFAFLSVAFRQLSKISITREHNLINYAQGGISGRSIYGTPQRTNPLEPEQEDLHDGTFECEF